MCLRRRIAELPGLSKEQCDLMFDWNCFIRDRPLVADSQLPEACFCFAAMLASRPLSLERRRAFTLHLLNLQEYQLLTALEIDRCLQRLDDPTVQPLSRVALRAGLNPRLKRSPSLNPSPAPSLPDAAGEQPRKRGPGETTGVLQPRNGAVGGTFKRDNQNPPRSTERPIGQPSPGPPSKKRQQQSGGRGGAGPARNGLRLGPSPLSTQKMPVVVVPAASHKRQGRGSGTLGTHRDRIAAVQAAATSSRGRGFGRQGTHKEPVGAGRAAQARLADNRNAELSSQCTQSSWVVEAWATPQGHAVGIKPQSRQNGASCPLRECQRLMGCCTVAEPHVPCAPPRLGWGAASRDVRMEAAEGGPSASKGFAERFCMAVAAETVAGPRPALLAAPTESPLELPAVSAGTCSRIRNSAAGQCTAVQPTGPPQNGHVLRAPSTETANAVGLLPKPASRTGALRQLARGPEPRAVDSAAPSGPFSGAISSKADPSSLLPTPMMA